MDFLQELNKVSAEIGSNLNLVQGAGGNTSIKVDDTLWVKASGKWLAKAENEKIFVPVDLSGLRSDFKNGCLKEITSYVTGEDLLRPSIETTFHACLSGKVVLHVHSINAIYFAVLSDGKERVGEHLSDLDWAWVPYRRPGEELTSAILDSAKDGTKVFILANHGLIVCGETVQEASDLLEEVERRLTTTPREVPCTDINLLNSLATREGFALPQHPLVHDLGIDSRAVQRCKQGVLYPDQAVFLGPELVVVSDPAEIAIAVTDYKSKWYADPECIVVSGMGVLVSPELSEGGQELLVCHCGLLGRLNDDDQVVVLDATEVGGLLEWDAEKYRQALN